MIDIVQVCDIASMGFCDIECSTFLEDDFGMFGFDFSSEDTSWETQTSESTTETSTSPIPHPVRRRNAVKSKTSKVAKGSQDGQVVVKTKYTRRKPIKNVLYAFPVFDKSDSLVYLPVTMTRHLNTSDFPSLARLLRSHLARDCEIVMHPNYPAVSVETLVRINQVFDEQQPDRIMCVHSTKVVENQICATIYKKFTACRAIYDAVARDTKFNSADDGSGMLHDIRVGARKLFLNCDGTQEVGREEQVRRMVEANIDVIVYLRIELAITFDDVSKKVTKLKFAPVLTSLQASDVEVPSDGMGTAGDE
jgi:hypothetical protein